ncbi:hypothetical protein [Rhodanobacter sp. DHB23]|uniref:hypothetical protein n=1 Tax=Rhodanobacter sp. DHB23 TaxID=2775923 RepID=UPI0017838CAF|nr:hypothetical protein [Rhodanobacter sp. DHB23]MBD8873471.1 hypothetical protein [Rhodanobacter sp. DHB23]
MKRALFCVLAMSCFLLGACNQQSLIDKFAPKADSATARSIIDRLRQGDTEAIEAQLDPRYRTPDVTAKLHEIAAAFPAGQPVSVKTVGFNENTLLAHGESSSTTNLTFEYQFNDAWVVATVVLAKKGDALTIEGLHAERLAESLETRNAFTFQARGAAHWLMLLWVIANTALCLCAFVLCLRTRIARRKWLWALFTLVGVSTLRFDWSNGHFAFQPLSVQLFGASAMAQPYGPWILGASIPLGAIWFLAVRRRLAAASVPPALPGADATP